MTAIASTDRSRHALSVIRPRPERESIVVRRAILPHASSPAPRSPTVAWCTSSTIRRFLTRGVHMKSQSCIVSELIITVLASWSCSGGDSTGPDSNGCAPTTTTVQATVTTGSAVSFDWSPDCALALLLIEDETGGDMWYVNSPDIESESPDLANRIAPQVTYGQVPAGMVGPTDPNGPVPAVPLVAGRTYKLVLWRLVPLAHRLPGELRERVRCCSEDFRSVRGRRWTGRRPRPA